MSLTSEEIQELLELLDDPDIIDQTTTHIFTKIDRDQNVEIDDSEFKEGLIKLFQELGGEAPNEEQLNRALKKIDTNNDGKISRVELKMLVKNFCDSLRQIVQNLKD